MPLGRTLFAATLAFSAPLLTGSLDRAARLDERLLAAHNRERTRLGVPPLIWDDRLAGDAARWAAELAGSGRFAHAPDRAGQGENLWAGTPGAWSPEEMVDYWIAEKADYKPGVFPAVSRSGRLERVGHYTQLIWRGTRRLGCALGRGQSEDVLVCRYAEPGNVAGERPI